MTNYREFLEDKVVYAKEFGIDIEANVNSTVDDFTIGVNYKLVDRCLTTFDGEDVEFSFSTPNRAMIAKDSDNDDTMILVMPTTII